MARPALEFHSHRRFWTKTLLLAATTIALIPILLMQSELGAQIYLWALVVIHLVGLVVFASGVSAADIAPSKWGFIGRVLGLLTAFGLLYLASKGLQTETGSAIFWGSLFAIWALHTAGLALLHIRGQGGNGCPFWIRPRDVKPTKE